MKILDLGCGTGYLSSLLADCVGPEGKVVAIDPNRSQLEIAEKHYLRPNLVFLAANDKTLPEDQYDLAFANYVLHWVENKATLLNKVYQNLKPGGRFAFTVPLYHPPIFQKMDNLIGPEMVNKMQQALWYMPATEYNRLATTIGFKVISSEVGKRSMHFATIEDLLKWYCSSTEGQFNPDKIDPTILEAFKQPFGDDPIEISFVQVTTVSE